MYINIGANKLIRKKNIVGIFDLDTSSHEKDTRDFLKKSEKKGIVKVCGNDLPKSFVLTSEKEDGLKKEKPTRKKNTIYFTTLSSSSLAGRNK